MNPRDFILQVYDEKIKLGNAVGIANIRDKGPRFVAGRLGYINFTPRKADFAPSKIDYFTMGIVDPTTVYTPLASHGEFLLNPDTESYVCNTERILKDEKKNTIHSDKADFVKAMNETMEHILTKEKLPLFIRNLSKIPGWQ
jgi:hypothetical protein